MADQLPTFVKASVPSAKVSADNKHPLDLSMKIVAFSRENTQQHSRVTNTLQSTCQTSRKSTSFNKQIHSNEVKKSYCIRLNKSR
jgi:hypothetical protein